MMNEEDEDDNGNDDDDNDDNDVEEAGTVSAGTRARTRALTSWPVPRSCRPR